MILEEEYPHSISLGYGGDYRLSYLRSLVIAEGHDHTLDSVILMDADLQGLAVGGEVLDTFRSCEVDRWIIPRDALPFEGSSFYGEYGSPNIFGPDLGRVFLESYEPDFPAFHLLGLGLPVLGKKPGSGLIKPSNPPWEA